MTLRSVGKVNGAGRDGPSHDGQGDGASRAIGRPKPRRSGQANEAMIYQRLIGEKLEGPVSRNKVRLLFGARQVGKTVLLNELLPEDISVTYNLQDRRVRRQFETDPSAFTREVRSLPGRVTLVGIDEIQKVPALLDEVQYLFDRNPRRFQFFLTGSSARKLRTHSANLLPGRCHVYKLLPVIREEEEDFAGRLAVSEGRSVQRPFPRRGLEERLLLGNLPGVRAEAGETAAATLEGYVIDYLEEEIRKEALVRNLGAFGVFLRLAAVESGKQVNIAKLSRAGGVPTSTLKNFYQVLVDTFVGYWLHSYRGTARKRLLTTPRFLFFDLGVRNAAAEMPVDRGILAQLGGSLLEQWVGLELIHRAHYAGRGHRVSFWRTASGAKVDFVWESPDEHIPVEVKWTDAPTPGDAKHVEKFLALNDNAAARGFVVCRVARAQRLTERTVAIPWHRL